MLRRKGRVFALLLIILVLAFVLSGQGWYTVSMNPNDSALVLKSFDGYTTYAYLSPLLLVCLAGTATAAISPGITRIVSFTMAALASSLLVGLTLVNVIGQNLSGVSKQIESATGIAATHGIKDLTVQVSFYSQASIVSYFLMLIAFVWALVACRSWVTMARSQGAESVRGKLTDPISLWDQQR